VATTKQVAAIDSIALGGSGKPPLTKRLQISTGIIEPGYNQWI
jgi:hypothetical protein